MTTRKNNYPAVRRRPAPGSVVGQPVDATRRAVFLRTLAETGLFRAAARAASPHADPNSGAVNSFRDLAKRDATFAAQVAEARAEANERLEAEAHRRAVEGIREPVFQKGRQAFDSEGRPAFIVRYSDNLLLRLLERRDPDAWSQHRKIEHSGSAIPAGAVAYIAASDIRHLDDRDVEDLHRILTKLSARRGDDAQVLDAEWVEVADDDGTVDAGALTPEEQRDLEEICR